MSDLPNFRKYEIEDYYYPINEFRNCESGKVGYFAAVGRVSDIKFDWERPHWRPVWATGVVWRPEWD